MVSSSVADLERAYWATYLGKTGSLNDLRRQGYASLSGSSVGSAADLEKNYLGSVLGISGQALVKSNIDDLRRQHRIQILTNEGPTDDRQDLEYKFWQVGFGPTVNVTFTSQGTEGTAAAQSKTVANLGIGAAVATRYVIVHFSFQASVQPSNFTMGGQPLSDLAIFSNGGNQYAGIAIFSVPTGTTASFVVDAGVGQTVQDVIAFVYRSDKTTAVRTASSNTAAAGAGSVAVTLSNSFWAPNDFAMGICRISGAAAGFNSIDPLIWESSFLLNNRSAISGDAYAIPNSPYTITCSIAGTTDAASVLVAVRLRVS